MSRAIGHIWMHTCYSER